MVALASSKRACEHLVMWKRPGLRPGAAQRAARTLWDRLEDPRRIVGFLDVSANVSNNRVFRLALDDGSNVFVKVSNYGSYFLFREDHDRLLRLQRGLLGSRFDSFLALPLLKQGHMYTYYEADQWAVGYNEVQGRYRLPRILGDHQIENLAEEIAAFHSATIAAQSVVRIPSTSTSIKSDAVHLLDRISTRATVRSLQLSAAHREIVQRQTESFLFRLDELGYDDFVKVPVLVDWNMGNFSVDVEGSSPGGPPVLTELSADDHRRFRFFSRWDYDWLRTETPLLDFYFLSRVSSQTGDRTQFTYGAHTLTEPRFLAFVKRYHQHRPLTEADIHFVIEAYRFFILHYVIAEGDHFFRADLWHEFQHQAAEHWLPALDDLDVSPLLRIIGA
jgi:hypothetical protein